MMRAIFIGICCCWGLVSFAQTRLIAHKSHSGSAESCHTAWENRFFEKVHSNFGRAPERTVQNAQLDSVILLSDTSAVMVTSLYCQNNFTQDTTLWRAGRDTLYHHPIFSKKRGLEEIKGLLRQDYYFKNPADSVRFIGFDRGQGQNNRSQNEMMPPVGGAPPPNHPPGATPQLILYLLGLAALLSLGLGWTYRQSRPTSTHRG